MIIKCVKGCVKKYTGEHTYKCIENRHRMKSQALELVMNATPAQQVNIIYNIYLIR